MKRTGQIDVMTLMENNSIASGQTEYSTRILEVFALQPDGNFSMQLELDDSSTGTATVFYECTNVKASGAASRFIKPSGGSDIFATFAKTDGAGADGRDLRDFNMETCHQARIGVTAVGGDIVVKKLIVAVQ